MMQRAFSFIDVVSCSGLLAAAMKRAQGCALPPATPRSPTHGFSLVELSIVLVILGLLTGGILAGQSLIRAAELRSIPADVARHMTAIQSFRDRYMALPGDMRNAVRFWGAQAGGTADGTDATCQALGFASPATTAATCNGNGDGMLGWKEGFRAWQQLANAGLVEGAYSGVPGAAGDDTVGTAGWNIPASKISLIGFGIVYMAPVTVTGGTFIGEYGNHFRFGSGNGIDEGQIVTGSEAWNIDVKIDDGSPATGRMRTYTVTIRPDCTTTDVVSTATYNFTSSTKGCNLLFLLGF